MDTSVILSERWTLVTAPSTAPAVAWSMALGTFLEPFSGPRTRRAYWWAVTEAMVAQDAASTHSRMAADGSPRRSSDGRLSSTRSKSDRASSGSRHTRRWAPAKEPIRHPHTVLFGPFLESGSSPSGYLTKPDNCAIFVPMKARGWPHWPCADESWPPAITAPGSAHSTP